MNNDSFSNLCRKCYLALGMLTTFGLMDYGLSTIIAMPPDRSLQP